MGPERSDEDIGASAVAEKQTTSDSPGITTEKQSSAVPDNRRTDDTVPDTSEERKATGPRTVLGKHRTSQNARTHGIFAKELRLSSEEKKDFRALRAAFLKGLQPDSAMLDFLFEDVVAAAWRMKIALRYEQLELREKMEIEDQERKTIDVVPEGEMSFPYPLRAGELRSRLKFLGELRAIVDLPATLSNLEKPVTQAFGAHFWKMITDWEIADIVAVDMAKMIKAKCDAYGLEPPERPPSPEEQQKYRFLEAFTHSQMIKKLFDLKEEDLTATLRFLDQSGQGVVATRDRLDLFLRYQTTARRDFYRALKEYGRLKWPERNSGDE